MQLLQLELRWLGQKLDCTSLISLCQILVARSCSHFKVWEAGTSGGRLIARSRASKLSLNRFAANDKPTSNRAPPQCLRNNEDEGEGEDKTGQE